MNINLITSQAYTAESIIFPLLQNEQLEDNFKEISEKTGIFQQILRKECKADYKEISSFYNQNEQKIILLGLGSKPNSTDLIKAFRSLFHQQKNKLSSHVGVVLSHLPVAWSADVVNGILLADYQLGLYKTEDKKNIELFSTRGQLDLYIAKNELDTTKKLVQKGQQTAETQKRIFDLVNSPSNYKNPQTLGDWAKASGFQHGFDVKVFNRVEIEKLDLKALLAVGQGSKNEPAFIILEYLPANAEKTVGLVGKGVTFDTGGISIKPSANMHMMKSDMGGAAAVLGTIELAAKLKLPVHLIGIIPATENSVDGNAINPGDVIGSYSGKTIEVIDTDAEGRLILADGLNYLLKNYQPEVVIDLATLTGSVIQTLGYAAAGLFTNNDELSDKLLKISQLTGEKLWRLPLWDDYKDELKSDIADVKNYHGKPIAGAIVAAKFLEVFTENHPAWAHLDIAGTAFADSEFSSMRAATAFGIRLLVAYLEEV